MACLATEFYVVETSSVGSDLRPCTKLGISCAKSWTVEAGSPNVRKIFVRRNHLRSAPLCR